MADGILIVGAGSAGCVLADRLTARGHDVVLVEAGPDPTSRSEIASSSFFDALGQEDLIWPELQARRSDLQDRRRYWRGRGVGGSSLVNAMVGLWGEVEDYDSWERDFGCSGWSWRSLEPYARSIDVPLVKADIGSPDRVGHALVETCRTLGWDLHRGPYALGALGRDVGPAMLTIDSAGQRVSVADTYLGRARRRSSFTLRTDSLVDRVIIEGRRARGVVLADGSELGAGTVVLCAGAIHSPAILLRSGIDRPGIGRGLQDHPSVPITLSLRRPADPSSSAVTALARFSSGEEPADLQLLPMDHLGRMAPGYGSIQVALMYVQSRGEVRLQSSDPRVDPVVDFHLLDSDGDLRRLSSGLVRLATLLQEEPLRSIADGVFIDDRGTPLSELAFDDPGTWMRAHIGDYVHAAGTCAMGDPTGDATVVDANGDVVGYSGLRVGDASIFPRLPRANTHFPVMMVAEALADRWS